MFLCYDCISIVRCDHIGVVFRERNVFPIIQQVIAETNLIGNLTK